MKFSKKDDEKFITKKRKKKVTKLQVIQVTKKEKKRNERKMNKKSPFLCQKKPYELLKYIYGYFNAL